MIAGGTAVARRNVGNATRVHTGTKCVLWPPAASLRASESGIPDSDARKDSQSRPGRGSVATQVTGDTRDEGTGPGQDLLAVREAAGLTSRAATPIRLGRLAAQSSEQVVEDVVHAVDGTFADIPDRVPDGRAELARGEREGRPHGQPDQQADGVTEDRDFGT